MNARLENGFVTIVDLLVAIWTADQPAYVTSLYQFGEQPQIHTA